MSRLIALAVKERKVTILLSVLVILYGFYAYYYLPRQENPDTSSPAVQIITVYPGASAKTVEEQVTKKVEDEIAALDGVETIRSYSQDNVSIVIGMLTHTVDYDEQWDKLRVGLERLSPEMPDGAMPFDVDTDMTYSAGVIISLSSDTYDQSRLSQFAKEVKDELSGLDGVKRVEIEGEQIQRIEVTVNEASIYKLGISIEDIYNVIRAQNVVIPPGSINTPAGKINVAVPKSISSIGDVENLIVSISAETGAAVRLKDVAKVEFSYDEGSLYYLKDSRNAVLVTAQFDDDENVVLIGKEVRASIDRLKVKFPEGLIFEEVLFQPEDVANSVNDFIMNLLQGVLFVVLVIFIGMGFRNAIVVSVAIPLSLAMTFATMQFLSVDVQQVSISALIISLGILVDNAIVISDAIQVHINDGMNKVKASYLGAKEQSIPVLTSTLTTVAAFMPLMSLPGEAGEFIESLPLVVIVTLVASYVVAMLVTPSLASMALKERHVKHDILSVVSKFYTNLLENNLKRPLFSLFLVMLVLIGAIYTFITSVDMRLFPYVDKDIVYVNISNEIIGDIESTKELVLLAESILRDQPEITTLTSAVGGGLPRFYMTADFIMPSENNGQILAAFDLSKDTRFETRADFLYHLQSEFDRRFVGGYGTANLLEINMPGSTIEVRISGASDEELKAVAGPIYDYLLDRTETMNVQLREPGYRYSYLLDVDDDKAMQFGLSKYDIQFQINLALNGSKATVFTKDDQSYDIFVSSDVKSIEDISNLRIKSSWTGNKILLKQFADVDMKLELDTIKRYNRETVITVASDVRPQYGSTDIQMELQSFIEQLDTDHVKISYGGDTETMVKYLSGLAIAALFALVIIYVILLIQFNSLIQPFIIMSTVPLALIGIVFALFVTGTNFTFTVGLGAASLIGIVVNNGILLIEYINRARESGLMTIEACRDSVSRRMRPILLSTVTTIFGLVPLVFADSSFFSPMAIALIGGLIVATIMTLTVVPTIYYVLSKFEKEKVEIEF
ncbi:MULTISPECIES: efflux RND transporter permease subunit [unclassified Fusibacter]|uniref:efflux RND transporter permease subunit n=1 Tax=unclassified Fusibacter TaxID=2624464 RepID=UPI001011608A|nr:MULTISPECIES: efflux RND transporter permease subunit [unclassified Fusibacter]MCK8060005.1 efflux RND transporter permease subunit [Fusibacter sp. A2]NPE22145.1 efflux RND transporter permease subunit [Fusibacter sp. A1]RXV60923.1 AcrB/AcrD/AcrF family protein [Fusibacter sp. A1]